jgi:hypothetical protein
MIGDTRSGLGSHPSEVFVLTTILGIPAHPLLIHAAVVFVPLLIAATVVYAIWPAARSRLDWAVAGLAIVAPLSVWFAKVSGQNFQQRLINRHLTSPVLLAKIATHQSYGTKTLWWTIALAVVALLLVAYVRRGGPISLPTSGAFAIVTIVLAVFTGYYVVRTGDTGAHIVWTGF